MSQYRILIVEDEKIIAKDLEVRLRRMNYQVIGAVTNCEDVLATLKVKEADLILMDIMIDGDRDGIETAHEVRQLYDVPIIFLTAYADESTFQRAKLSDPFGYILKPFQERELDLTIQTVLQKHRLERTIKESELRYRLLFENSNEAILILDDEAVILDANPAAGQLYGQEVEALTGQAIRLLHPDAEEQAFGQYWQQALVEGRAEGRLKLIRQDGAARYADYSLQTNYQPGRHLAVGRDVTEKVMNQREIATLARIPDEAPSPILRVGRQGQVLYANPPARQLLTAWRLAGLSDKHAANAELPTRMQAKLRGLDAADPQVLFEAEFLGRHYSVLAVYVERTGYINLYAVDITDRYLSERLMKLQKDVLEMVAISSPLAGIYARLLYAVKQMVPGVEVAMFWRRSTREDWAYTTTYPWDDDLARQALADVPNSLLSRPLAEGKELAITSAQARQDVALAALIEPLKRERFGGEPVQVRFYPIEAAVAEAGCTMALFMREGWQEPRLAQDLRVIALRLASVALDRDVTFRRLYHQSLVFENINDAIILTDNQGVVTDWSPAAERIFLHSKRSMLGKPLAQAGIFAEDVLAGLASMAINAREQEKAALPERLQAVFSLPGGGTGWAEISKLDLRDPAGSLIGNLKVARDITAKKRMEQQLDMSEQHLKAIFDNSVQSFILLDEASKVLAFNRLAEQWVSKISHRRIRKGSAIGQIWPTGNSSRFKQALKQAHGGQLASYEDFIILSSELSLWLELSLLPVRDEQGRQTGVCLTALDISERKDSAQTLARSEARFRSLVQNSSDLVLLLDVDGIVGYASESSMRITGYSPDKLIGRKLSDFVHGRDKVRLLDGLRRVADLEETRVASLEYRFYKEDGTMITVESILTNHLADMAIRSLVLNTRDMSERRAAEESLRNIVRGVSSHSEEDYFVYLADNLAVYLALPNVILAECEPDNQLKVLAMVRSGEPVTSLPVLPQGRFADDVLHAGYLYVSSVAGTNYADDALLTGLGASAVIGVAMRDGLGRPSGVLIASTPGILDNFSLAESMLKIFSVRAAMELDRIHGTRALLESKANLTALVENTSDAIWSLDASFRFTALNTSFRQRFAHLFAEGQEIGADALALQPGQDTTFWQQQYSQALDGLRIVRELTVQTGRSRAEYEVSFNPIVSGMGTVTGVSVFARDITERKKSELALRQSEANLLALIENTDDIIYSLDAGLKLITSNSSFSRAISELNGYPLPAPSRSRDLINQAQGPFGKEWTPYYKRALAGERFAEEFSLELEGEKLAIETSFNPILTKDRTIAGVSVMARDITQRKRAEDELKRTNFELDSFVYRASHDLRAPLRSVLGLINLIRMERTEEAKTAYLALAEKSINKLDNFISDLTHFSRNSRMELSVAEVDFAGIIEECLENLRFMERADRVEPLVDIQQEDGVFCSDPQRIVIVFQNLISNAIKYQREGPEASFVRIFIRTNTERCYISVEDNGKGIQAEYLPRIFEMFFRASEDSYGSGLGLYITAQVIEKLRGKTTVHSIQGEGTRFEIEIPNERAKMVE